MSDQYRGTIKQSFAWWDVGSANLPSGLFTQFNEKFKAWEKRRGFSSESDFNGNPFDKNEKRPDPVRVLKGRPLVLKKAFENKKKMLAKEAEKAAKKAAKKGLKDPRANAKFAPEIVGMQYSSGNNAQRKIKQYILKNMSDQEKCFECGEGHYQEVIEDYRRALPEGEILIVPKLLILRCDKCGEDTIPPESSRRIETAVENHR